MANTKRRYKAFERKCAHCEKEVALRELRKVTEPVYASLIPVCPIMLSRMVGTRMVCKECYDAKWRPAFVLISFDRSRMQIECEIDRWIVGSLFRKAG